MDGGPQARAFRDSEAAIAATRSAAERTDVGVSTRFVLVCGRLFRPRQSALRRARMDQGWPGRPIRSGHCKDSNRDGSHEHEQFTFLGYTFRPRRARNRSGELFVSFCPAVSGEAAKEMRRSIKRWRLHLWSGKSLADLAQEINPTVRGWINFYGRFYRSELVSLLENINEHLARWAMRKFKRLRGRPRRARRLLAVIAAREPNLFAHWVGGARPLAG